MEIGAKVINKIDKTIGTVISFYIDYKCSTILTIACHSAAGYPYICHEEDSNNWELLIIYRYLQSFNGIPAPYKNCTHKCDMKFYVGLVDSYNYCTKCDKKEMI